MIVIVVIIPAYEPDTRLICLLQDIKERTDFDVVVIDDGSSTTAGTIFREAEIYAVVLKHEQNLGKGRAIKTGLEYVHHYYRRETGIVIMDADGQHTAEDMGKVCRVLGEQRNALVLGSRQFTGLVPARSRFGNTLTRYVVYLACGVKIKDTQTGLRAFSSHWIPKLLEIPGERYEYEMNVLLDFARKKRRIVEIPIETIYLEGNRSSHFRVLQDSARIYKDILIFSCSSFLGFLTDFLLFAVLIFVTRGMGVGTSLLVSNVGARVVSAGINYYINKNYVFKNKDGLFMTGLKYFLLAAFILSVNTWLLALTVTYVCSNKIVSKIMVELLLFIFSWVVQKRIVFRRKESHA